VSKLGALVAIPLGLFAIKQLQKQFPDEKDSKPVVDPTPVVDSTPIVPLVPTLPKATPAEPIIPFKTLDQRAKEAAFQREQEAKTREELIGIGPSGFLSL
tara:strand:+ start:929 stop:1228 length:300 start_codon:yes stop_codon:yes gene_type:complete